MFFKSKNRPHNFRISREDIYYTINLSRGGAKRSIAYNLFILLVVVLNLCSIYLIVLTNYAGGNIFLTGLTDAIICYITGGILAVDYILRWITADFKLNIGKKSFLLYPITPMALFDLLALLPTCAWIGNGLQCLKVLRFFVLIQKVKRKTFNINSYIHGITEIASVFKKLKIPFISASIFVIFFVFFSALLLISAEPKTFNYNFLDALYWSAISWTGVGYGDIAPVSAVGRIITLIAALISIILIALPVSVVTAGITAGYIRGELKNQGIKVNPLDNTEKPTNTPPVSNETNFCPQCGTKCDPGANYCKKCGQKLR